MLAAHSPARQGSYTTMNFMILKIKWDSKRGREELMETHNTVRKPKERHNSLSSGYHTYTPGQHWVLQPGWEEHRSSRSSGVIKIPV